MVSPASLNLPQRCTSHCTCASQSPLIHGSLQICSLVLSLTLVSLCRQGVMPDIVTMAKGIGNGLPLAAVVTTPEIAQVSAPAAWHLRRNV